MEENMILDGYEKTSSTIEWFYKSLRTLTTSQGKDFLKFVIHDGLVIFIGIPVHDYFLDTFLWL